MNKTTTLLLVLLLVVAVMLPLALSDGEIAWSYGGLLQGRTNAHFLATDWYEVNEWEVSQCAKHLETEVFGETDYTESEFDKNAFVYDTAVTLQVFKEKNEYTDEVLYEVGWYVHPSDEEISFYIELREVDGGWEEIIDQQEANPVTGNSGYHAWIGDKHYDQARLVYGGEPFVTRIIDKASRR